MKVLTLDNIKFEEASSKLADMAQSFNPDLIIGIPSGGGYVGRIVCKSFPEAQYIEMGIHRNGTQAKSRLKNLFIHLPETATNFMRIIETYLLKFKKRKIININPGDEERIKISRAKRIMIVDDAIDSGATMASVLKSVCNVNPEAEIKIGVLAITTRNPLIKPDYTLYSEGVLLRFPWSNDYKEKG